MTVQGAINIRIENVVAGRRRRDALASDPRSIVGAVATRPQTSTAARFGLIGCLPSILLHVRSGFQPPLDQAMRAIEASGAAGSRRTHRNRLWRRTFAETVQK